MNIVAAWNSTKKKRDIAESVAIFCIDRLMPRMQTLDVCIELSDDMENADGYCLSVTNREFVLEIDSRLEGDDFISAITHEMVHVKQHARNELKDCKELALKKWKGEEHIALYTTVEEYMNLPWEEEAYRLQEVLLNEYKQLISNDKKS
jgi:hypothetical protein